MPDPHSDDARQAARRDRDPQHEASDPQPRPPQEPSRRRRPRPADRRDDAPRPAACDRRLADVHAVAGILDCSTKTVRRMADAGKLPGVVRLGRLLRFDLAVLSRWIGQGCPPLSRFDRTCGGTTGA